MATTRILIVDDDASVRASLALLLKQAGLEYVAAADPEAALSALEQGAIDLVLQDMNFSRSTTGEEGLVLLHEIRRRRPALPVVLITAWGTIDLAVAGMKAGAADFATKPWDNQRLLQTLRTALELFGARASADADRESLDEQHDFSEILGTDPAITRVLNQVVRVARTDATVLIHGESGTGKELLANAIHANSARVDGPLVKVNMGAIVPALLESEMFGHVRGAFTDAKRDRAGYFEQANGGTIFLDEVTEVDRASQVKLLRVLQDRSFQRVGSSEIRHSDFRVVAATNRDLGALVASGQFRDDLYYRLNLITLTLPPLRARKGDIPLIAAHQLRQVRERYGLGELTFAADVLPWLAAQPWRGNIRELRHCVERVALMADKPLLTRVDFEANGRQPAPPGDSSTPHGELRRLDETERLMIERALEQSGRNITRAAELLGLSRFALYRRLAKHGLTAE
jgi:two-component system NtrC family response regulator